jgi:hypothetical protein
MMKLLFSRLACLSRSFLGATIFVGCIAAPAHAGFTLKKVSLSRSTNFIAALYEDLLGRAPNASQTKTLVTSLASGQSTGSVVTNILTSTESRTFAINKMFQGYLGRDADSNSLATDLQMLQNGGTLDDIRIPILYSDEYYDAKTAGPDDDHTEYVKALFQDLLGRAPTNDELTIFVGFLVFRTRAFIIFQILSMDEAQLWILSSFYTNFLGRTPTTDEKSAALLSHQNDPTNEALEWSILSSDEYYVHKAPLFKKRMALRIYFGSYSASGKSKLSKLKVIIYWGDGRKSRGELVSTGTASALFGTHRFKKSGKFTLNINGTIGKQSKSAHFTLTLQK